MMSADPFSTQNMRLEDRKVAEHGDEGQGDRLIEAKRYITVVLRMILVVIVTLVKLAC